MPRRAPEAGRPARRTATELTPTSDTTSATTSATTPVIKSNNASATLADAVVAWQRRHGRHDLPWQRTRDPYRVWLSEVMLQQTQVATVLGYYERFLARYADVRALAAAPLDDVLALWSGLGYYSRARNLHRCAQAVVAEHGGEFPRSAAVLATLPGIGRSTAAAIAGFCFEERVAILDGNVKRVLTRVLGFDADLAVAAHERELWQRAGELLPASAHDMPAYTQGLMDLGASLCSARKPLCGSCPLQTRCVAAAAGDAERYPVKTRRLKRGRREHGWLWLQCGDTVWLQQRPDSGVWAGLWALPLFDDADALHACARALGADAVEPLPRIDHALTHFDWVLHPHRAVLKRRPAAARFEAHAAQLLPGRWVPMNERADVALPAPLRRLLAATRKAPL